MQLGRRVTLLEIMRVHAASSGTTEGFILHIFTYAVVLPFKQTVMCQFSRVTL